MRYDIKITKMRDENSNLLGYADLSLGGAFVIKGIKIMNGSNGPFISMPNYRSKRTSEDGEPIFKDFCHISKADFHKELTSNILAAYEGKDVPRISRVSCTVFDDKGNLKGLADVTFNDSFVIKGVKVMDSDKGVFVSMPNYKVEKDGHDDFRDICFPTTAEFREEFNKVVLDTFESAKNGENVKVFDTEASMPRHNITVHKIKDEDSSVLAYADISIGGAFVVKGVKIMDGNNGLFVAMPNYKTNKLTEEGKEIYQDVCFPSTAKFREKLYGNILSAYDGSKKPLITDVKCATLESDNLKGLADVTFDDCFVVSGVKIMDGDKGVFVSMPNYKVEKDGHDDFRDICFPTTAEFREEFNSAVMDAYNKSFDFSKDAPDLSLDERSVSRGRSR
jgi:DNA-binding cell septation regulator SpoVG